MRLSEPGEPASDADLLARYTASRDEAAFELLVWRHAVLVAGVCRRILRDEHLVEDAFQAAFLILARKAGSIRGTNLAGWLFRVARRVAIRARRDSQLRAKRESSFVEEPGREPHSAALERAELSAILDEEIARLPERLRLPVLLCYLGGSTTEDAARRLSCPRGTILSRLSTARSRLAVRLTRRGIALPACGFLALVVVPTKAAVASLVPTAARHAIAFRLGIVPISNPRILAEGVLHTMKTNQLLSAAGTIAVAVGLIGGFGALVVRAGRGEEVVAAEALAAQPAPAKDKPQSATEIDADRNRRDVQSRKLEGLSEKLKDEIQSRERAIQLISDASGISQGTTRRQDVLAKLDAELAMSDREILELEATIAILKKRAVTGIRIPEAEESLEIKKAIRSVQLQLLAMLQKSVAKSLQYEQSVHSLTADLDPLREALKRVETARIQLKIERDGVNLPTVVADAKLDAVLKELQELRREVKELREQRKP